MDPTYQRKFSIAWASIAAFFIIAASPSFIRFARNGRARDALTGVREDGNAYEPVGVEKNETSRSSSKKVRKLRNVVSVCRAPMLWTATFIGLDLGQRRHLSTPPSVFLADIKTVVLVVAYYVAIILCIVLKAELIDNPNRAGFMAIAQLPPVFLFATKNSPLAILLSSGYEKLNYLHRWCSRGTVLAAAIHGALWIRNHRKYGLQILGAQKETSGVAALALLFILAISSVRPARIYVYQVFRIIQ